MGIDASWLGQDIGWRVIASEVGSGVFDRLVSGSCDNASHGGL